MWTGSAQAIETERLLMRACRLEDATALASLMTPDVSRKVALWPDRLSPAEAEEIIKGGLKNAAEGIAFPGTIIRKSDNRIIGWMNVEKGAQNSVTLGLSCWFGTDHQRSGYAFEAMQATVKFGFDTLNAEIVTAGAQLDNVASHGLITKIGLQPWEERDVWAIARNRVERCQFFHMTRQSYYEQQNP